MIAELLGFSAGLPIADRYPVPELRPQKAEDVRGIGFRAWIKSLRSPADAI